MCGFVRWLRRKLNRPKKVEKGNKFVENALSALPNYGDKVTRMTLDGKFWMVDKEQMKKIVEEDMTDKKKYQRDLFDCDNFSLMFVTHLADTYDINQAGIVLDYSSQHSYNVIVYPSGDITIFEPQKDKQMSPKEARKKELYKLENATILL